MNRNDRDNATVLEVHTSPARVTVLLLGTPTTIRYPVWYTPKVGDLVVVEWLHSQPYVATVFA